ncbi:MAG: hypothetical protein FWE35_15500 [Streptosporangiales bacterium]|nr:hypothetical protein [Streptosporangiales bacterium]
MRAERKIRVSWLVLGGAALVGVVLLVKLAHWPVWAELLVTIVLLGILWLTVVRRPYLKSERWAGPDSESEDITVQAEVIPEPEFQREPVTGVRLPSSRPDYDLVLSGTVCWQPVTPDPGQRPFAASAVAVDSIVQRARGLAEKRDPVHLSLVQHEMRRVLSEPQPDTDGRVWAMAESVELTLPEEDRKRLDELAEVRKNGELWDHQRRQEQSKRQYLGGDVLKSPGSALVWWLARNENAIGDAVENIDPLQRLSDAANDLSGTDGPFNGMSQAFSADGDPAPSATDLFDRFMRSMRISGDEDRTYFAHQVADLVEPRDPALAGEMRARFDIREPDDGS